MSVQPSLRALLSSIAARWLLVICVCAGQCHSEAAEYLHTYVYNSSTNVNRVWWDQTTTIIEGVIVHMNYATGAALYSNTNWRNFAKARRFAMLLSMNQDSLLSSGAGVTIVENTLQAVATASGRAELSAWQPYIFCGLSRGGSGAYGAIAQGWAAGRNRTIACVAYHGNSLVNNLYANTTDSKNIPVLYLIASLDYTRQADIEDWVRQGITYGYSLRLNGALWTTSMQYGASHTSTGDDTYPLQWLGRCIDARLVTSTRGSLKAIATSASHGANYTMASPNTTVCAFTNISVASSFVTANKMIWLPPNGVNEWLRENSTLNPVISDIRAWDTSVILTASNGIPGASCVWSQSTNLAESNWQILLTNYFGVDGTVRLTNRIAPSAGQNFYRLRDD
jgi:hypothetical protein